MTFLQGIDGSVAPFCPPHDVTLFGSLAARIPSAGCALCKFFIGRFALLFFPANYLFTSSFVLLSSAVPRTFELIQRYRIPGLGAPMTLSEFDDAITVLSLVSILRFISRDFVLSRVCCFYFGLLFLILPSSALFRKARFDLF